MRADITAVEPLSSKIPGLPLQVVPISDRIAAPTRRRGASLRLLLLTADAAAAAVAWVVGLRLGSSSPVPLSGTHLLIPAGAATAATLAADHAQRLYQSRVAAIRALEIMGLARSAVVAGAAATAALAIGAQTVPVRAVVAGTALAFSAAVPARGIYMRWLSARRSEGRYVRPIVVVGAADEAAAIGELFRHHPELGYRAVGWCGPAAEPGSGPGMTWIGAVDDAPAAARSAGAGGVVIASSALSSAALNRLVRRLLAEGLHVHLSSGLLGIDRRRVRTVPMAHEPMLYVEAARLTTTQRFAKRTMDVTVGAVAFVLLLPVMVLAAAAIALEDGRPVLFRQTRVGLGGRHITVVKLRTMHRDAAARAAELAAANQRAGGPLFKLADDPRTTRVGRFLRTCGIDELPQLWNVLGGSMSLVGPRPALPEEVARFDEDHLVRQEVRPGITGLWQVEARANPSFFAYRHLDLFYVENWSPALDVAILLATAEFAALTLLQVLSHRRPTEIVVLEGEPA